MDLKAFRLSNLLIIDLRPKILCLPCMPSVTSATKISFQFKFPL